MILEPTGTWQPAFNLNCGVEKPNDTIPHPDQLVKWGAPARPLTQAATVGGARVGMLVAGDLEHSTAIASLNVHGHSPASLSTRPPACRYN